MDIGIASVIIALILGVSGIGISVLLGYVPRKRKSEIIRTKKELLQLYQDVLQLLEEEKMLLEEAEISKLKARRDRIISSHCEPARIKKRIKELESQMQNYGNI